MASIKEKILLMSLVGVLSGTMPGCNHLVEENAIEVENKMDEYKDDKEEIVSILENTNEEIIIEEESIEDNKEESIEEKEDARLNALFPTYPVIIASTNVNIRDKEIDGNILGVLKKDSSLKLLEKLDNGWYKVEYYGNVGFVSGEYSYESIERNVNLDLKKVCYSSEDVKMYKMNFLTKNYDEVMIPALESFEIYEEHQTCYLVKVNNYIGYVDKELLNELTGTFVIVDISDQELTLYSNNEIILKTPVVTGKPSTPSDKGLFEIYNITYNRKLIGSGYASYVDIMMKYNGGEGLHDAEYHTNEDGYFHGWREKCEFGGETYLTDGSHGCVNMLHDDVMEVSEYVGLGSKVLVGE